MVIYVSVCVSAMRTRAVPRTVYTAGRPPLCFISLPAETVKEILYIRSQVVCGKVLSNHSMQSVIGVSVPSLI